MSYYCRDTCRACQARTLTSFLHLGILPLANAFRSVADLGRPEPRFPLTAAVCRACFLVQLKEVVSPELLFREYPYFSSASAPLVEHFRAFADVVARHYLSGPDDLVVEVGSNDGVLLQWLRRRAQVLGVDPAENVAAEATARGIETLPLFFNRTTADHIRERFGRAAAIVASNVFAHVDDLDDFLSGVASLLSGDGVFIIEVHWVKDLVTQRGFDQIYHEHLSYFGLRPLVGLLARFGIEAFDAAVFPVHGQLLRVFARKSERGTSGLPVSASLRELLRQEKVAGLDILDTYHAFADSIDRTRHALVSLLSDLRRQGKRIAGYGAPAKGNILLNYCRIGPELIEYITDTTPAKQGRFTPGTAIPVVSPERARIDPPDYFVLFAWNYADAILERERAFRAAGGKFIIPIPEPRLV